MSIQYRDANGIPHDEKIHEEILSAVNFTDTSAYSDAIERLVSLGLTEAEANELMREQSGKPVRLPNEYLKGLHE